MIYTTCGHNQVKFSEVITLQVRKDPPRYVHLCKSCVKNSIYGSHKMVVNDRLELLRASP